MLRYKHKLIICDIFSRMQEKLTDVTCNCRSFFSCSRVTIFSSSSFFLASAFARSPFIFSKFSFMAAISFSVSALFSRGLILKYSFIHGQCFTFMNERMLYWMEKMDSLDHRIRRSGQILCVNMKC